MKWTDTPTGVIRAAENRLWTALGDDASHVAERINTSPEILARIARNMQHDGFEPSTSIVRAKEIMGDNFFGIPDMSRIFEFTPTPRQLAMLNTVPFRDTTLKACSKTHILIAVLPVSIVGMQKLLASKDQRSYPLRFDTSGMWYAKHAFATTPNEIGWQLIRIAPVDGSFAMSFNQQRELLAEDEELLPAGILVYAMIGHYEAYHSHHRERLFNNTTVRSADIDPEAENGPVYLGQVNRYIRIWSAAENTVHPNVGIASQRIAD